MGQKKRGERKWNMCKLQSIRNEGKIRRHLIHNEFTCIQSKPVKLRKGHNQNWDLCLRFSSSNQLETNLTDVQ